MTTTVAPGVPTAPSRPRMGRRDRIVYACVAIATAAAIAAVNDAVTKFLTTRSQTGYGALFFVLPLLVILTRPLEVSPGARRHHVERALAAVYGIRSGRRAILWAGFGLWIAWIVVIGGISLLLVAAGLYLWSSIVANWALVTMAVLLLWNLFPGRFHLMPGATFTVAIHAPAGVDRTAFAGLVALDTSAAGWATSTSESGDAAVERLHSIASNGPVVAPPAGAIRLFFSQPRVWSRLTGDRSLPVDIVDAATASRRETGRRGTVVLVPRAVATDSAVVTAFLAREMRGIMVSRKKGMQLRTPVAVVVEGLDVPAETAAAVRKQFGHVKGRVGTFAVPFDPAAASAVLRNSGAAQPIIFLLGDTQSKKEPAQQ